MSDYAKLFVEAFIAALERRGLHYADSGGVSGLGALALVSDAAQEAHRLADAREDKGP